jgi:hypothetical protein
MARIDDMTPGTYGKAPKINSGTVSATDARNPSRYLSSATHNADGTISFTELRPSDDAVTKYKDIKLANGDPAWKPGNAYPGDPHGSKAEQEIFEEFMGEKKNFNVVQTDGMDAQQRAKVAMFERTKTDDDLMKLLREQTDPRTGKPVITDDWKNHIGDWLPCK